MQLNYEEESRVRNILRQYNISANFTYGQNFLTDESVLDEMIQASKIGAKDQVLEIGPGIGNLTRRLLKTKAFV